MKIAFVDGPWPHFGHRTQRWAHKNPGGNINPPPIFQMYAAAVARRSGFEVALWDAPVLDKDFETVVAEITRFSPDAIVQNTATASFDYDMQLARLLKQKKDWLLIMVGPHVTALAADVMQQLPEVDVIALGEYDETIAEILSNLGSPEQIAGIVFRKNGQVIQTKPRELIEDLDKLPYPAWDLVQPQWYWESMFPKTKRPIATILSSRGCNFSCSFCLYPQVLFQHRLRLRDLGCVVDEIEWLKTKFGANFFYFEDDNFTASWKRVEAFCQLLLQRKLNISWGCLSRTDKVKAERLKLMKASGCFIIKYGVESGDQSALDLIDKKKALSDIVRAFDETHKVGIMTHATVMIGVPNETRASVQKTRKFIKKLGPDSVQFSICMPLPGTRFWEECLANGWLSYDRWEDFDGVSGGVLSYPGLSKTEIRAATLNSYLDYYASASHIKRRIKRTLFGPERMSQMTRNFWMLKRLSTVLSAKVRNKLSYGH